MSTFDLNACSIIYGAPLTGFGEGSAIKITQLGPSYVSTRGTSGKRIRVKTGEKGFSIEVSLLQNSASNAILSALKTADLNTPGGILLPFAFKDSLSADVFISPKAWIMQWPDFDRSDKASSMLWKLECMDGIPFYGGVD